MKESRRKAVHQFLLNRAQTPDGQTANSIHFRKLETQLRYWETYGRLPPTSTGVYWITVERELNRLADTY